MKINNGLVIRLNGRKSNSIIDDIWLDESGNGYNFTLRGVNSKPTRTPYGVRLDKSDSQYVGLDNTNLSFSSFTVEVVGRSFSYVSGSNFDAFASSAHTDTTNDYATGFNLDLSGNATSSVEAGGFLPYLNFEISRDYGGFFNSDIYNYAIAHGVWRYFTIVVDADNDIVKIYENGFLIFSSPYTGTITYFDRISLGARTLANRAYFLDGEIGGFQLYNRPLTESEILQNVAEWSSAGATTSTSVLSLNHSDLILLHSLGEPVRQTDSVNSLAPNRRVIEDVKLNSNIPISGGLVGTYTPSTRVEPNDSLYFDGNTYLNYGDNPFIRDALSGDYTISFWINVENFVSRRSPWYKAHAGEGAMTIEPYGEISYYYGNAGNNTYSTSNYQSFRTGVALQQNTWHHVALVRDLTNGVLKWFVDGVKTNEDTANFPCVTGSEPLYIGSGDAGRFLGSLDNFRIFRSALSESEVAALATEGTVKSQIYLIKGTVRDANGNLAARRVLALNQDTLEILGSTVSEGGYFELRPLAINENAKGLVIVYPESSEPYRPRVFKNVNLEIVDV